MTHISELKQDPVNINQHSERGTALTRRSIEKFGARLAGIVDRNGYLVDGNDRQIAFGEIGMEEVEVIEASPHKPVYLKFNDLDLADPNNPARELQVALHRSAVESWTVDADALLAHMGEGLNVGDWWRQDELDALLAELQPEPEVKDAGPQVDRAEELRQKWGVESGQLWQLGEHRLVCGDCTDAETVQRVMGGERADLLVADPEYDASMDWMRALEPFCNRHWLVMAGDRQVAQLCVMYTAQFNQFFVLHFRQFSWNLNVYIPILTHLLIAHLKFGDAKNYHLNGLHSVLESASKFDRDSEHEHAKHVELMEPFLVGFSTKGDIVLDPFAGSGTTGVACQQLGRKARMVEISPAYCAVILERFAQIGITPERMA